MPRHSDVVELGTRAPRELAELSLRETPFDRRHRMATVLVDTLGASGAPHVVRIPYVPRAEAADLLNDLYAANNLRGAAQPGFLKNLLVQFIQLQFSAREAVTVSIGNPLASCIRVQYRSG